MTRRDAKYLADQVRHEIIAQLAQAGEEAAAEYVAGAYVRDCVKKLAEDMADD